MKAFLATCTTFAFGLGLTTGLGYVMEHHQRALHPLEEDADVRGGFLSLTANGYPVVKTRAAAIAVSQNDLPLKDM